MKPQAYLSVGRSRRKIINGKYYLKNGTEFEIELFNGSTKTVGVKIKLNGSLISESHLVIKPGQRYFLDRFIDQNKKLLFSEYEIDSSNEAKKAIQNNGLVEVEFYDQILFNYSGIYRTTNELGNFNWSDATTLVYGPGDNYYGANTMYTCCSFGQNSETVKTGRIEEGSKSNQEFSNISMEFSHWPNETVKFQILPETAIEEVRAYCTECGVRKRNDSWKFCPKCGTNF